MLETIRKQRQKLYYNKALLKKEKAIKPQNRVLSKRQILKYVFTSESYKLYDLENVNHEDYVTDYQQMLTGRINGDYSIVLNDKVIFEKMNRNYISVPKTYATISKGTIVMDASDEKGASNLMAFLIENDINQVIIKPISDSRGNGVDVIKIVDEQFIYQDNQYTPLEFDERMSELDRYFISEFLIQSKFEKQLYSETINSMRILTMIDPVTNEPFIPVAVQRIGTSDSNPTDNFHRGGLSANIDIKTGELSSAASIPYSGKLEWHKRHPETNAQLEGIIIPNWEAIKKQIIYMSAKNPDLKYVGWDVVITESGISILEGNSWPDVNVLQLHNPLLLDERVKEFYEFHNII